MIRPLQGLFFRIAWLGFQTDVMPRSSSIFASRLKEPLDPVYDVFMIYEVATVGRFNSALDPCRKFPLALQHPGNGFFDNLCGLFTLARGELFKLCFRGRREMNFHGRKRREEGGSCQGKPKYKFTPRQPTKIALADPCPIGAFL